MRRRLDEMFGTQAAATPGAIAIVHRGREISYAELDGQANRIARHLAARGVGPGTLVGLCLERSPDLVAALIGILKTGAAYVPLDPEYPQDRLAYMLENSAAALLLTRAALIRDLPFTGMVCDLDAEAAAIEAQPGTTPRQAAGYDDPAYVIYTSGSTGQPKGVMLCHTAAGLVEWGRQAFTPHELTRMAATTSICFDPSILEIFVPLCNGGGIVIKEDALEPFVRGENPTIINGPPSVIEKLARMRAIPASVQVINVGGERLTRALVTAIYDNCAVRNVYNHYGPTEATTCAMVAPVARGDSDEPTIGRAICDSRIYVLLADGSQAAITEEGEIHIAGPNLAMGYLNNAEQTERKFVPDPFYPGERMYRTGDLGRLTPDGNIEFIGRIDDQVKLRGFRIELGEIEAALTRLPGVRQAAALVQRDERGRDRLATFVVSDAPQEIREARRRLAEWLPHHALPNTIITLPELPLSPTGKVDRAALLAIDQRLDHPETEWMPPIEEAIVTAFRRHLGNPAVGLDDDFFDLGGDSLLAVDTAMAIESALGTTIPPAALAQYSTPRALAAALDEIEFGDAGLVTALQPEGVQPPVFCMPDVYGRPISYVGLARHLAPDQPVFGLSVGPIADRLIAAPDLCMLVDEYVRAIRERAPRGPYRIAGYSFGSHFAYQLACTLERAGEDVSLILIDGPVFRRLPKPGFQFGWAVRELRKALATTGFVAMAKAMYHARYIAKRWYLPMAPVSAAEVPMFVSPRDRGIARALLQSLVGFDPQPFMGRTLLVRCEDTAPTASFLDEDGMLGWKGLLQGLVTIATIRGSHYEMMREPRVADVADEVRRAPEQGGLPFLR